MAVGAVGGSGRQRNAASKLLVLIDAAVLKAYELPGNAKRVLEDYFRTHARPGPVGGTGSLPDAGEPRSSQVIVPGFAGSPDRETPLGVFPLQVSPSSSAAIDESLRVAIQQAWNADGFGYGSEWSDGVRDAVYRHGVTAVKLLRAYLHEGSLRGGVLAQALRELGYVDERSSHEERRSLLVAALSDPSDDIRHAAAEGLAYLADPASHKALSSARVLSPMRWCRRKIDDAIAESGASRLAP